MYVHSTKPRQPSLRVCAQTDLGLGASSLILEHRPTMSSCAQLLPVQATAQLMLRSAVPVDVHSTKRRQASLRVRVQTDLGLGGARDPRLIAEDRPLVVVFVPDGAARFTED